MIATIKGKLHGIERVDKDGKERYRGYLQQGEPGDGRRPEVVTFYGGEELRDLTMHQGSHIALEARVYASVYRGNASVGLSVERFALWGQDGAATIGATPPATRAKAS